MRDPELDLAQFLKKRGSHTISEVRTALASIGLQPTPAALGEISSVCRDFFLERMEAALLSNEDNGTDRVFLTSFLRCFAPATKAALAAIGLQATPKQIADIAKERPKALLSALPIIADPKHEKFEAAVDWLRSTFSESPPTPHNQENKAPARPAPVPESPTPVPTKAPSSHDAVPPRPVAPSSVSNADTQKSVQSAEPPNEKQYATCHVYGSSYALCFNAGDWDGKPGIMVDAAVSTGTRSYDWQNAVHLWLNANELGGLLAVLRRFIPEIEFRAHGQRNEKSFSITRQGTYYHVKVACHGLTTHGLRAVKLMPHQIPELTNLVMGVLVAAYPTVPPEQVLASIKSAYAEA